MAKITRLPGNHIPFASDATNSKRYAFGTTNSADDLASNLNADYRTGWEATAGGVNDKPTIQDFNALGYTQGQMIAYLMQAGVPEYDNAQEYYQGSVVTYNGSLYISRATNTGRLPSDASRWTNASSATTWAGIAGTLPLNKLPNHSGNKITSGTVREPYIDGLIARRQAVTTEIAAALRGVSTDVVTLKAYATSITGSSMARATSTGSGAGRRYVNPSNVGKQYMGVTTINQGDNVPTSASSYVWEEIPGRIFVTLADFGTAGTNITGSKQLSQSVNNFTSLIFRYGFNSISHRGRFSDFLQVPVSEYNLTNNAGREVGFVGSATASFPTSSASHIAFYRLSSTRVQLRIIAGYVLQKVIGVR